jgi:hypothetical protein
MFTDMVNPTDEALVMQVVRFYFPRWDKGEEVVEEDGSEESSELSSKHSGGAEKGEKLTCSRTASAFYDYCRKVQTARESSFRAKWDEKLRGEAIKRHKEELEEEERIENESGKENKADEVSTTFDADMMNGCWGGIYEDDELPTATTV